ncbi:unnamed protein product [Effrenium voratum]|uniref:Glycosyltransferase 2-like domain-containing protein n=1 Tax=Effrenium voratum TaxID=2562239 RepID=A0AA36I1J1_9DINO|nr:unnamed protein product [Effrenium voratum]CAJ1414553.1 unnamed protein product [Effrenium voratum]
MTCFLQLGSRVNFTISKPWAEELELYDLAELNHAGSFKELRSWRLAGIWILGLVVLNGPLLVHGLLLLCQRWDVPKMVRRHRSLQTKHLAAKGFDAFALKQPRWNFDWLALCMYSLVAGWFVVCHLVPRAGDFALLPYSLALLFMVSGALHKAIAAAVGLLKLQRYQTEEFKAPCDLEVLHFAILANYTESIETTRDTLESLAACEGAEELGVVLALEERDGARGAKAKTLEAEFGARFGRFLCTVHPCGRENEIAGKAANVGWAASCLFRQLAEAKTDLGKVVLTVMDADSELHPRYFRGLSYHWSTASEVQRELTIWQPPVLEYKNYHTQLGIVRLRSVLQGACQLGWCADPRATRLLHSTYSVSARLAQRVGWEKGRLTDDWHFQARCWLWSAGALNTEPIFLPVVSCGPEAHDAVSSLQAFCNQYKRHALGLRLLGYLPTRARGLDWRGAQDLALVWLQVLYCHLTALLSYPFLALLLAALGAASELLLSATLVGGVAVAVLLTEGCGIYRLIQDRIAQEGPVALWSGWLPHLLLLYLQSLVFGPIAGALFGGLELFVALKLGLGLATAVHEVCPKPKDKSGGSQPASPELWADFLMAAWFSLRFYSQKACATALLLSACLGTALAWHFEHLGPAKGGVAVCQHVWMQDISCGMVFAPERGVMVAGLAISALLFLSSSYWALSFAEETGATLLSAMGFPCSVLGVCCGVGTGIFSLEKSELAHGLLLTFFAIFLTVPVVAVTRRAGRWAVCTAVLTGVCIAAYLALKFVRCVVGVRDMWISELASVFEWLTMICLCAHVWAWPFPA